MSKIKEHYEYEINKLQITEKRLRDEISNKQVDLKTLKAKLQTFEQSKASLEKKETHTVLENDKLNRALQNEKQKNDDLGKKMLQELEESSKKIEQANKKIQKIEPQYVILKGYAIKLEAHYKTKKGEFAEEIHMANSSSIKRRPINWSLRTSSWPSRRMCKTRKITWDEPPSTVFRAAFAVKA